MSKYRRFTRSDRHDKRQRHKRKILFFSSLSILFLIIFVSLVVFGNKGNPEEAQGESVEDEIENTTEDEKNEKESNDNNTDASSPDDATITLKESNDENEEEDVIVEEIPSDDENVIKAFKGNWEPVGTNQQGPHTINYNDGSEDRIEIKQAVEMVTDLDSDDMVEHWVGRDGDQEVVATVYNGKAQDDIYRVYLQWVDEEGWQPTKTEELKHLSK